MRWRGQRQSGNLEDRRGSSGGGVFNGRRRTIGMGGLGRQRRGRMSFKSMLLIGGVLLLLGVNPMDALRIATGVGGLGGGGLGGIQVQYPEGQQAPVKASKEEDELKQFMGVVLAQTEDVWNTLLPRETGRAYQEPKLVLFRGGVRSGCGFAGAQTGPFYCPVDQKMYLDLSFFDELKRKLGAPGDFAQAYVIAHEVGHHVQNQLGILDKVQAAKRSMNTKQANALQVRVELMADCLAGVWARQTQDSRGLLEEGDFEEALGAAAAVGDDALQKQAQGYVVPDSFTHGASEDRMKWFKRGYQSPSITACNTLG